MAGRGDGVATHRKIVALHRYFMWADRMRVHAHELIRQHPSREQAIEVLFAHPYFVYWYAGTFVLLDGWRRLNLHDSEIDGLLESDNVKFLEQHRHAAYHFHPRYFDDKMINFIVQDDAVEWIHGLREAFSRWFLAYFESRKETA